MTDRTVKTRLTGDVSDFQRSMLVASASAKAFTKELDTSSDRTAMLTQSLLAVGPALVPITASAIPAVSGLTNQLAFAAAGAGVTALAFSGVGDALKAVNDYAIEPTDANLQKMRQSLAELGPAGREFVMFLQEIRPQLQGLQDAAQEGLFPGAQSGIEDLMALLPQAERIVGEIASSIGDLIAEGGENLASPRWAEFFDFLETEARPTLIDMGRTIGNLVEGFANLWMAFDPLSDQFSDSFLQMSRDFATWTDGLDETDGFQEFLDYVSRVGPQVWDTLGALGNGLLQIVEAAAPVGEVALPVIEAIADGIAAIADSDAGPVLIAAAAGISAISRALSLYNVANGSALGSLLTGGALGGGSGFKRAAAATTELKIAQDNLARSAVSARDAQFALIPTADKRKALADYSTESKKVAEAEKAAGEATKARNAQMRNTAASVGLAAFAMSDYDDKLGLSNAAMGAAIGSIFPGYGTAIGGTIGLIVDLASANNESAAAFNAASDAIMKNTGTLEEQGAALKAARESSGGGFQGQIDQMALAELEEQYAKNARAAQDLRLMEAGLADAMLGTSDFARDQVDVLLQLLDARNELTNQALAAADSELAYEQSISSANERIARRAELEAELAAAEDPEARKRIRKELDSYAATLDKTTEAGQANRRELYNMAGKWNDLDPAIQGAAGAAKRARSEFVDTAMQMGATREKAEALADKYLEIPSSVSTKVTTPGADAALTAIQAIQAQMTYLALMAPVNLIINTIRREKEEKAGGGAILRAIGGSVVGAGTGTSDDIPAMLSNGEHVLTADDVQKAGGQGEIYRLRAAIQRGDMPAFATGGAVSRYDTYSDLEHSSKLDIERQRLRIQDIQRSLNERETVGKGKNKSRRDVLRGRARKVAELELREAKKELAQMQRENRQLKNYGTPEQEEFLRDEAERVVQEADDIAREAASSYSSAKSQAASLFEIGSATSAAAVDRNLARLLSNSQTFLGLLGDLKAKGASPWLLGELVKAGPTGGAIRLARQYNNDQAALNNINAQAAQIDQYTNAYAGLVGNAAFMAPAAWSSGVSSASQQPLTTPLVLDGAVIGTLVQYAGQAARIEVTKVTDGLSMEGRWAV